MSKSLYNVYAMYAGNVAPDNLDEYDIVECSVDDEGAIELEEELTFEGCTVVIKEVV